MYRSTSIPTGECPFCGRRQTRVDCISLAPNSFLFSWSSYVSGSPFTPLDLISRCNMLAGHACRYFALVTAPLKAKSP